MNNTQLYLSIGIPTVTVILAWLASRADNHRLNDKIDKVGDTLRSEMIAFRREVNSEFTAFRANVNSDFTAFRANVNSDFTAFRANVNEEFSTFRKENHSGMLAFRREMHEDLVLLHERVVKVETKQDFSN